MIVTRFAPSPTGFLHIGGARTALFSYLYARRHQGKFLLRIEDTDLERSTDAAKQAIIDGLAWLELTPDDEVIYQSQCIGRHKEIAAQLLKEDKAYHCYCSPEEVQAMRDKAKAEKRPMKYDGTCRHRQDIPKDKAPVVRLKAPQSGEVIINDTVQGDVKYNAEQMDDLILLRSDGTPTYMLAVVVDDHDMAVTHIIRGDDHLTNAARQILIYQALSWEAPNFSHIPLIHGEDGAKLSKRHGALGVENYRDMGYLPEAVRNYLLRLGWSHGDDEIITDEQAVSWFSLDNIGKSPARFDVKKLDNVNGHYMRESDGARLVALILPLLEKKLGHTLDAYKKTYLEKGMNALKERAKTLLELADNALFYVSNDPLSLTEKAIKQAQKGGEELLEGTIAFLGAQAEWKEDILFEQVKEFSVGRDIKIGVTAGVIRTALTYSHAAPSVFEAMEILGKDETLRRLQYLQKNFPE